MVPSGNNPNEPYRPSITTIIYVIIGAPRDFQAHMHIVFCLYCFLRGNYSSAYSYDVLYIRFTTNSNTEWFYFLVYIL